MVRKNKTNEMRNGTLQTELKTEKRDKNEDEEKQINSYWHKNRKSRLLFVSSG
jgi:hypothetical protein